MPADGKLPGGHQLLQDMGGEGEIVWRKAFLEFNQEDIQRLTNLNELAQRYATDVIEDFYKHLLSFEETAAFFRDPAVLDHVKRMQKEYFLRLTEGDYGTRYVENRLNIGAVHERINLPPKTYLGAYNFYMRAVARRLMEADQDQGFRVFLSLMKLVFLDISLAIDSYILQRERTIREQQDDLSERKRVEEELRKTRAELEKRSQEIGRANEALQAELNARQEAMEAVRALSTPALPVREQLLVMPLIGVFDSARALQLTEQLLGAIRSHRAKAVVIDITGVAVVDSKVANHLLQTVEACRLMGSAVIVSGLSPEVAQTLVRIGVDLSRLRTVSDLRAGLEEAEALLGYRVVKTTGARGPGSTAEA